MSFYLRHYMIEQASIDKVISIKAIQFFDCNHFNYAEEDVDHVLTTQRKKKKLDAEDYAQLMDLLNYMYPFREGNGRSTRLFLQCYAPNHGQCIVVYPLTNNGLIQALNNADVHEITSLIKIEDI